MNSVANVRDPLRRPTSGALAALLIILALSTCAPSKPVQLKVGIEPLMAYAPLFLAREEGFFKDRNLSVEFVRMSPSGDPMATLIRGDLDVAGAATEFRVFRPTGDAETRVVSDKGRVASGGCSNLALVARPGLVASGELKDEADLKDRKVAFRPNSFEGYFLDQVLKKGKLALDSVQGHETFGPSSFAALANGTVDLAVLSEPFITHAVQSGSGKIWRAAEKVIPGFQLGVVVYAEPLLEKNSRTGRRFIDAYLEGVRQYEKGKTNRNLEILSTNVGADVKLLKQICWPEFNSDGDINLPSIKAFQKWAVERALLKKVAPDKDFWTDRFLD